MITLIKDYEIRRDGKEEVLYIYVDFGSEFAKLKGNDKKKKLGEVIHDYLNEHDIKFDGKKIAIVSSGLVIATLLMKSPNIEFNSQVNRGTDYQNAVVLLEDDMPSLKSQIVVGEPTKDASIPEKETSPSDKTANKPTSNKSTATTSKPNVSSSNKGVGSSNMAPNTSSNKPASTPTKVEEKPVPEVVVDNNTYVTVKRSNGSVIKVELEEYVIGVVGAEMPAAFNIEALKAQAVIARTYALKALERGTVLTDNSSTQNYKSDEQLKSMWGSMYQTYHQKIRNAVSSTKGVYLTYSGTIIDAVYHSTSNGQTEDSKYVWGNALPYLVSVSSPYDSSNPSFSKSVFFSYGDLSSKLGVEVTAETPIQIEGTTLGKRVEKLAVGDAKFTGVQVRSKLGLRSADFDVAKTDGGYTFTMRGYGHGVGLSQYGANGMANHGYDYASILKHYYTGVTISHR